MGVDIDGVDGGGGGGGGGGIGRELSIIGMETGMVDAGIKIDEDDEDIDVVDWDGSVKVVIISCFTSSGISKFSTILRAMSLCPSIARRHAVAREDASILPGITES
jgi:hypothetical protein